MEIENSVNNLTLKLLRILNNETDFIILCLGTNKCVGDSLGCVVGSLLKRKYNIKNYCYGDLLLNVNAYNIVDVVKLIAEKHSNQKVLVIDSAVSERYMVGNINIKLGGIIPRSYINSTFDIVGDVSITGIVGCKHFDYDNLFFINKYLIYEMAEIIAKSIIKYKKLAKIIKNL